MGKVREMFVDILVEAGIDHVFGLPGGATPILYDALVDRADEVRTVLARHEGGAACMADMYGRLTGKPGVLMGQGLWIGTSGGYGIVEAYLAGVPMVVIADVSDYSSLGLFGPYQNATGDFGAVDLPGMMKAMTKFCVVAANGSDFLHGLQLAIKHAVTGRPGPTAVLTRWPVGGAQVDPDLATPRLHPLAGYLNTIPPSLSPEDAEKIAAMLQGAQAPVMVAGVGVHRGRAYEPLRELAELLGLPVATTYMGKSALAETHPLSLGTMGVIGQKAANQAVTEADLILAVGTCLAPDNTKMLSPDFIDPERQKIVQIDIEPLHVGWTFPLAMGVTADAAQALTQIVRALKAGPLDPEAAARRASAIQAAKKAAGFFAEPDRYADSTPIAPERVVAELNDLVQPDDLIVLDAGNNRMWMAHHFQTKQAGQLIAAGGAAGVGYGPPASLAAQLLNPNRRVVCVCGDGGLMMHLYTMEMAKEYGLPVTTVVLNNACLGNVMDFQRPARRIATTYPKPDFAAVAKGFGIEGLSVERPEDVGPALEKALASDKPTVVDVAVADYAHNKMMN